MRNITLLICSLLVITCASSTKEKCSAPNCDVQSTVHSVTYSNKGTKSEAKHGHLTINSREIPDVFTLVISGGTAYRFLQRRNLWGMDGYFPVDDMELSKIKRSSKEIRMEDLQKGWYMGNEVLEGTPSTWIYTEWDEGSALVAPEAIEKMVQELDLKKIQRWEGPKLLKDRG